MTGFHLEYALCDGYVHNWLLAGPWAIRVPDLERFQGNDLKPQVARHYHLKASDIHQPPIEWGTFQIGQTELTWRYYRCQDDHFVDVSTFRPACEYLRTWAYSQVVVPEAQDVTLVLTTNGPADLWLNRQHVHRHEHFLPQEPQGVSFQAQLQEGANEILVRFEEVAIRECPYVMALRIARLSPGDALVKLPIAHRNAYLRQKLERIYSQAYVKRPAIVSGESVTWCWAEELDETGDVGYWIEDGQERIQTAGNWETRPGECSTTDQRQQLFEEGPHHLVLVPPGYAIERSNITYQERLPFYVSGQPYSDAYYGTYDDRRREALVYAANQENDLYAEIAKFALGRGVTADGVVVDEAIQRINDREDGSASYLVGLVGLLYRHGESYAFPNKLRRSLEQCILAFRYWHDEPGTDAMGYTTESHAILFHTCELLAGQLYPEQTFPNSGQTGAWHRHKSEQLARQWLRQRASLGFCEWDSNCCFEEDLLALSHLADLAEDAELREMAAVVADKLLLTVALNSFKGVFGSTHGRTYAPIIKSAHLEPTSGITRLLWGMGVWNKHIRGAVALACSSYEMPSFIAAIATDLSEELWNREQHQGVNKVTYRTADYMLSSVQDYNPGQKGCQQHVWQATLGPEAVAFVTHPPLISEEGSHRPSFWAGNRLLPRIAQWKDTLVALHQLPADDRLGFTHAYMPLHCFDEHLLRDGWAFARRGSGYLALWAVRGLELVERGPTAYRELRSRGQQNVWLCRMGRKATDGNFGDFQEAVLGLKVEVQGLSVRSRTLRGEDLSFGWQEPLRVGGVEQPLSGFPHYDSRYATADYPASQLDIRYRDYTMRLLLGT